MTLGLEREVFSPWSPSFILFSPLRRRGNVNKGFGSLSRKTDFLLSLVRIFFDQGRLFSFLPFLAARECPFDPVWVRPLFGVEQTPTLWSLSPCVSPVRVVFDGTDLCKPPEYPPSPLRIPPHPFLTLPPSFLLLLLLPFPFSFFFFYRIEPPPKK